MSRIVKGGMLRALWGTRGRADAFLGQEVISIIGGNAELKPGEGRHVLGRRNNLGEA